MRKYEQKLQELQLKKVSAKIQEQIDDFKEAEGDYSKLNERLAEEKDPEAKEKIKQDILEYETILQQADEELVSTLERYARKVQNLTKSPNRSGKSQPPAPASKTPEEQEAEQKAAEKAAEQAAINERLNRLFDDMKRISTRKIYTPNPAYRRQKA